MFDAFGRERDMAMNSIAPVWDDHDLGRRGADPEPDFHAGWRGDHGADHPSTGYAYWVFRGKTADEGYH